MVEGKQNKFFKLKYYREKYGYSQKDFANIIRLSESSYSHKETKITPMVFDEMVLIYDELNRAAKKAGDPTLTLEDIFLDRKAIK